MTAQQTKVPIQFKTQLYLKTLLKKQNKTVTVCPICRQTFKSKQQMKQHKLEEHSIQINDNLTVEYIILPQQHKGALP